MPRNIGELGARREPLDLEFTYFGKTIRIHPTASDSVELEFLQASRNVADAWLDSADLAAMEDAAQWQAMVRVNRAVAEAQQLVVDSLKRLVHPDDWDTYWAAAKDNGQRIRDLMTDMKRITAAVIEDETGFPTTPPSASQDGPTATQPRSADGFSSAAATPTSDADKALFLLRGRPDLQEFVVMAEEAAADERQRAETGTAASRLLAGRG